jgi:hypothetical protein
MHAILQQQGFRKVEAVEQADLVVYFDYGVRPGLTQYYTTTTPIYEWTGGEVVTYSETERDADGNITRKTGQTVLPWRERIVGYDRERHSYTPYSSYAVLEAKDARSERPLWRASATASGGGAEDLRQTMPFLAVSLVPWLAKDSGGLQVLKLPPDDPRVVRLRSGVQSR